MKIEEITRFLEELVPLYYQEDYDNCGLLTGNPGQEISAALISLDCTEEIIAEAASKGCGMIISHHPVIFKGLKKLTGSTAAERTVIAAIRANVAIYAIHTNLDHVQQGVNAMICEKLGLENCRILSPKPGILKKLVVFCPVDKAAQVRAALFAAGAGETGNYAGCSFNAEGFGTFKGNEQSHPFAGEPGKSHQEPELRIETVFAAHLEKKILSALFAAHPYEEVAYDSYTLAVSHPGVGAGMTGTLNASDELEFLKQVKETLGASVIRYTALTGKKVKKVAVCGGSGSFLLQNAIAAGADMFITADYKYHDFFDAEGKIVIADVGHFESEQFTQQLLFDIIRKKFPTFALHLTEINTNPINYLI